MRNISRWLGILLLAVFVQVAGVLNVYAGVNSWSKVTSSPTLIQAIAVDKLGGDGTIYVGTTTGIHKSTDGGANFSALTLTGFTNTSILSLAVDPTANNTVYAGTNGGGLYKTINGGGSWTKLTGVTSTIIYTIGIRPDSGDTVFVGTNDATNGGVWISTDATTTATFTQYLFGSGNASTKAHQVNSVEFENGNFNNVYLGTNNGPFKVAITKSGQTYSFSGAKINTAIVNVRGMVSKTASLLYTASVNVSNVGTGYSVNPGTLASTQLTNFPGSPNNNSCYKLFNGILYVATNAGVFKSTDFWATAAVTDTMESGSFSGVKALESNLSTEPTKLYAGDNGGFWVNTLSPIIQTQDTAVTPNVITSLAFGNNDVGSSKQMTFGIKNTKPGILKLNGSGVTVTGTYASEYAITAGTCTDGSTTNLTQQSFPENFTCTVNVTFTAADSGARPATIHIASNDGLTPDKTLSLTGNGNDRPKLATSTPSGLAFGDVAVNGSSSLPVIVTNDGGVTLTVSSATITGINAGDFDLSTVTYSGTPACSGTTNFNVLPGTSCGLLAVFSPTSAGDGKSSAISISSNDPLNPSYTVTPGLTGNGKLMGVMNLTASTDFGNVDVNATNNTTIKLENTGGASLTVNGIALTTNTAQNEFAVTAGTCVSFPKTLAPAESCFLAASFSPKSPDQKIGTLEVTWNTSQKSQNGLIGYGNGLPNITVAPSPLAFASVNIGSSSTKDVTITNNGTADLIITGFTKSGTYEANFAYATNGGGNPCGAPPITLAGAQGCTISVTFTPLNTDDVTNTVLNIASNDTLYPDGKNLALTGKGLGAGSLVVTPSSFNFGKIEIGGSGQTEIELSNAGTAAFDITSITSTFSNIFTVAEGGSNPCDSLAPTLVPEGQGAYLNSTSCTLLVTFTPLSVTTYDSSDNVQKLTIAHTASETASEVSLYGEGVSSVPTAFINVNGGFKSIPVTVAAVTTMVPTLNSTTATASLIFGVSGSDIAAYKYKFDAAPLWSAEIPVIKTTTKAGLVAGLHTLKIVGKNISGYYPSIVGADYEGIISTQFWVDVVKPITTLPVGLASGSFSSDQLIDFTSLATDTGSMAGAPAPVVYCTINGLMPTVTPANLCPTKTIPLSPASLKVTLKYFAVDPAGNAEPVKTKLFAYKPTQATTTITGVSALPTKITSFSFKVGGPGVVTYRYTLQKNSDAPSLPVTAPVATAIAKAGLTVGTYTINVWGINSLGVAQDSATTATWTIEQTAPSTTNTTAGSVITIPVTSIATLSKAAGSYTAALSSEAGSKIYYTVDGTLPTTASASFNQSGNATVTLSSLVTKVILKYFAVDFVGNVEKVKTVTYFLAPIATLTGVPTGTNNLKTASITVGGAGVIAYKYTFKGVTSAETPVATKIALSALTDATYTMSVIGKNANNEWQSLGNLSATPATTASWTTDITPPATPTVDVPGATTNTNQFTVNITGDGTTSKIYYTTNGTVPTVKSTLYTGSITINYATTLKFIGVDAYGNISIPGTAIYGFSTARATITAGLPATGYTNKDLSLTVGGTGVAYYVSNIGTPPDTSSNPTGTPIATKIVVDVVNATAGAKTLYVAGRSLTGAWQDVAASYTFTVDKTAPTTTAPADYTAESATSATLTSEPTATIYYTTTGIAPTTATLTKFTGSGVIPIATSSVVKYFAVDLAGNAAAVETHTYGVKPRALLAGAPASGGFSNLKTLSIKVSGTNVTHYKYNLDSSDISSAVETAVLTPIALSNASTTNKLTEGPHTLYVFAKDKLGTYQTVATTVSWTSDFTAPVVVASISGGAVSLALDSGSTEYGTTKFYYTKTGIAPTVTSTPYTGTPIPATTNNLVIKYIAKDAAGNTSAVQTYLANPYALFSGIPLAGAPGLLPATKILIPPIVIKALGVTHYSFKLEKLDSNSVYQVVTDWSADTPVATKPITTALAVGTYRLSAVAKMKTVAGSLIAEQSTSNPSQFVFIADNVQPNTTTKDVAYGWYATPFVLRFTNSDNIYYTTNGTVPTLKSLKYNPATGLSIPTTTKLAFAAIDPAGNIEKTGVQKGIYQVPPISDISGIDAVSTDDLTFRVSGANVATFKYKLDSGTWSAELKTASLVSLFGLAAGDHMISVIGKDAGGTWQRVPTRKAFSVQ